MEQTTYSLKVSTALDVDQAEAAVRDALAKEGFGILARIDIDEALREKLGVDIGDFRILGACNPPIAERAIRADPAIGVLLPCNVVVRRTRDGVATIVEAMDPAAVLRLAEDPSLGELAVEARERIERALTAVAGRAAG
ncbi:MAG TPA: DUF302 domain-containing protein [Longimicrobiales bacterium]|nr:DUF302 domain-containing protein [Longimicrobiales bacterium]